MFLNLFYYLGVKQTGKHEGGDMMLKDLTNERLIRLNIEAADWEEAIRKSAQPLIDEHKVKQSYVDDMITGVKENGPYIVLTKHVALPHARPESGALESAIGIATSKTPVVFGNEANDPVKYLFCLSEMCIRDRLIAAFYYIILCDNEGKLFITQLISMQPILHFLKAIIPISTGSSRCV